MKGTNLGEFEELILLMVANLYGEAYGLQIRDEIIKKCNRSVSLSTVHAALHRLEKKGFLRSHFDKSDIGRRGGRESSLRGGRCAFSCRTETGGCPIRWGGFPC